MWCNTVGQVWIGVEWVPMGLVVMWGKGWYVPEQAPVFLLLQPWGVLLHACRTQLLLLTRWPCCRMLQLLPHAAAAGAAAAADLSHVHHALGQWSVSAAEVYLGALLLHAAAAAAAEREEGRPGAAARGQR